MSLGCCEPDDPFNNIHVPEPERIYTLVFTADNPCLSNLYGQNEIFMAHAGLTSLHGKTQSFNHTMYS